MTLDHRQHTHTYTHVQKQMHNQILEEAAAPLFHLNSRGQHSETVFTFHTQRYWEGELCI